MKNIMVARALELVSLGGFFEGCGGVLQDFLACFTNISQYILRFQAPQNPTGKGNTDNPISVEGP